MSICVCQDVFAFVVAGSSAGVSELLPPGVGVADIMAPGLSHTALLFVIIKIQ